MKGLLRLWLPWALACLSGCAAGAGEQTALNVVEPQGRTEQSDERYLQRMLELRKAVREAPSDAAALAQLRRAERAASAHFLAVGQKLLDGKDYAQSIQKFELGLVAEPGSAPLQQARLTAIKRKEIARLVAEEQRARTVGNLDLAQSLIERARAADPNNESLRQEAKALESQRTAESEKFLVRVFNEPAPIAVNFRDARLKDALHVISESYGLNYVYDPSVEDAEVGLSARNVTFKQAFAMILQSGGASYKPLGSNTVLIYQNTPEKRAKYADMYFKVFHLYAMKADKMAELLKTQMDLKTVTVNSELNTVQVRDTRETLDVIEKLIAANDRTPAEIMLDVEILEISRTRAEQLGLDYGTQASLSFPADATAKQFVNGQFLQHVLGGASVTLPSLTLKYMQREIGGRVLAKPSIRTLDGRTAKIHIGDRVPLRSSTVQDTTGQTRTLFEYRDIGVRLDVLPKYHLDDTVTVELTMEVSSLGDNLGTATEPAYAIGTRNISTTMLLREGETAMLGGLIRDDERRAMNKVPGLGDMGLVGQLFANNDDTHNRTDLLLTITPKVIREQALPKSGGSSFYGGGSGNGDTFYDYLKETPPGAEPPRFKMKPLDKAENSAGVPAIPVSVPADGGDGAKAADEGKLAGGP